MNRTVQTKLKSLLGKAKANMETSDQLGINDIQAQLNDLQNDFDNVQTNVTVSKISAQKSVETLREFEEKLERVKLAVCEAEESLKKFLTEKAITLDDKVIQREKLKVYLKLSTLM